MIVSIISSATVTFPMVVDMLLPNSYSIKARVSCNTLPIVVRWEKADEFAKVCAV